MYKEVILAKESGCQPEIICFEFDNWSKELNDQLKQQLEGIKIVSIPAGRVPFFAWFGSVATETIFRILGNFISLDVPVLSEAVSRRSSLLIKAFDKVSKPDWVIGHSPGTIWPAVKASKKFNCKVGFDVEDYHPGEGNDKHLQSLTKQLMNKLLPQMNYVSFAAPLIMQQLKGDIHLPLPNWFTVFNYFPSTDFVEPKNLTDGPVKMVWFSQNISAGRGLEIILSFVKRKSGKVELHLIGNLDPAFYKKYLKDISNIIIHPPMKQKKLHHLLAQFDIGLALDIPVDLNRNLAITNKLLAYLQSGLFVVATNTTAQECFLKEFPEHGVCFDYKTGNADAVFGKIISELNTIRSHNNKRYENFKNSNWEASADCLLKVWND